MNETYIPFTVQETQFLENLLTTTLNDMRVEEHRTRSPRYRKFVLEREDLAKAVLNKVRTSLSPETTELLETGAGPNR